MRATTWGNTIEAPSDFDPADFAKHMQRMAGQVDDVFATLTDWAGHMTNQGQGEKGTQAIIRANIINNQTATAASIERTMIWDTTLFDNTGTASGSNELYLPDQDKRYWWYIGTNLITDGVARAAIGIDRKATR